MTSNQITLVIFEFEVVLAIQVNSSIAEPSVLHGHVGNALVLFVMKSSLTEVERTS